MFYTYIYLDPRKPGNYVYGDYTFEYEPFYVGKGCGDRYKRHLECLLSEKFDTYFYRKIRKIEKETCGDPIILKIEENLSEQEAFDSEIFFIWGIGRYNINTGPLTNLTDGGEGSSGTVYTKEQNERNRLRNIGRKHTEETKKKMSFKAKGIRKSAFSYEHKQKLSASHKNISLSDEHRKKIGDANRGKVRGPYIKTQTKTNLKET